MAKRLNFRTYRAAAAFSAFAVAGVALLLTGCPPPKSAQQAEGTYLVSGTQMYGDDSRFDLRDTAVYGKPRSEGLTDPSINVSDQQLTINRCTWCHECGFQDAFDWKHFGTDQWSPRYVGDDWRAPLNRMKNKENTMIQEEKIVERIYGFLRDSTLGTYNESADDKGAVVIELGDEPADGAAAEQGGQPADSDEAAPKDDETTQPEDDSGGGGGGGGGNGAVA